MFGEQQKTDANLENLWNEIAAEESPAELPTPPAEAEVKTGDAAPAATDASNPAEGQGQKQEAAVSTPPAEDPYAGLPEAAKAKLAKIDELENANRQLTNELKTASGRVSAMQREFDLARKAKAEVGAAAPTDGQVSAAFKSPERWESLKKDFPEWGEAMEELVKANLIPGQPAGGGVDLTQYAQEMGERIEAIRLSMAEQLEEAKVELKYENWKEDIATPEFAAWIAIQPPDIQGLADSPKARDAIRMLDLFNQAKSQNADSIKQERGARLSVAATQKGPSAPAPKRVEDMTPEELWEYEAKRMERQSRY